MAVKMQPMNKPAAASTSTMAAVQSSAAGFCIEFGPSKKDILIVGKPVFGLFGT